MRISNSLRQSASRVGSPTFIVLIVGLLLFFVLLLRGLNFGPLQTDVIIIRSWFKQVGVDGFAQKYFETNQRHILAGSFYALVYRLFGEQNLPYNAIFQLSRVFEGVFLAGIVYRLIGRRALAVCAGLALMLTMIRVRELYQGINWFIEPTLVLLLASSYTYLLSLQVKSRRWLRAVWYIASAVLYIVSILIYESGLPWIAVNLFLGWAARCDPRRWRRIGLAVRDAIPSILAAGIVTYLVLFVFTPWQGLAPDTGAASPLRVVSQAGTALTFPVLVVNELGAAFRDGYAGMVILFALLAALAGIAAVLAADPDAERIPRQDYLRDYFMLFVLALVMLLASILVGTSNQIGQEYLDRITFGRAAGISLLYVTLVFAVSRLLLRHWSPRWSQTTAVGISALLLLGPGFADLWIYQDVAFRSRAEIDRLAKAVMEVRRTIYLPAHLVIVTDPDWVLSKFTDASDVILQETQQKLFDANEPATLDFLKTGMYPENYATLPGTCETVNGQRSGGLCLDQDVLHSSRWAKDEHYPYEDVVLVHWDARAGTLTILRGVSLADLPGYNITSAGPTVLRTNPARVAVPIS